MIELTDENFEKQVIKSKKVCVVGFGTDWCNPCVGVINNLSKVKTKFPKIKFCELDVDKNLKTTRQFNVIRIPQVLVFKNGNEVGGFVGYISQDKLEELISSCPGVEDNKSNGEESGVET